MLSRTFKRVKIKGKTDSFVREQYLRDDIHCHSPLCESCLPEKASKTMQLDKDVDHYAIPCMDILENYLEILECQEIKGIIILQSLLTKLTSSIGHRYGKQILNICKDARRGSAMFLDDICQYTHVERLPSESQQTWLMRCCIKSAEYYTEHLKGAIPVVLISENVKEYEAMLNSNTVEVLSLKQYLQNKWKGFDSLLELYDSLTLSLSAGSVKDLSKSYDNYLPTEILEAGIKSGRYFKGHLQVNKHHASQEAFVASTKVFSKESGDIFIWGMIDRNRAVHGDEVVVEIYPKNQWKSKCMSLNENPYEGESEAESNSKIAEMLPTGKVVGVWERCWRNYVATLPEESEDSGSSSKRERILVIPYDYRIPKIRILTKQAENLRNQRIIVRIDHWETDSQYPNGHLVQTLGEIGNVETEIQTLLIEHDMSVGEFSQNLLKELPLSTKENPWKVEEEEIGKRRDLRNSHLIFSIDPKDCEDVDDTLSVRELSDGLFELGVHIADVTYFVQPFSKVDLEAKCRSTSVYLPDRRYDMLPHVLSGNLCSLLGNVARYAVSVIWQLDSNCQVKNVWYGRTIIKSSYKLCYEVAQDILSNAPAEEVIPEIPELHGLSESDLHLKLEELKHSLFNLYHIANVLRKNRLDAGGLELNSINMKFEIDKMLPSVVSDIRSAKELPIHKTVAECMIFANHWVAKKICETFPHQSVLRKHPNPREADLLELQKLALTKGFYLEIQCNKELALSLEKAVDKNDPTVNQVLRILATRTMNQATYFCTGCCATEEFYHYGLGLDKYTHFTSPIRRYADVLVHRLLIATVDKTDFDTILEKGEIEELCNHMNKKHKAAQDLEMDAKHLFLSFFIEELSSKNSTSCLVDGIIYSLLANGALVFIPKYGIKGAVYMCNKDKKVAIVKDEVEWTDGYLEITDSSLTVKAENTEQKYSVFDHVTICMKVIKSRSHQHNIAFNLVKNTPYVCDLEEVTVEMVEEMPLASMNKTDSESEDAKRCETNTENVNLYLFLERIKAFSIADVYE